MEIVSGGTVTICGGSGTGTGAGGAVTIIGGYGGSTSGNGGSITISGGSGATYISLYPTFGCSMMGSVQAIKPVKESISGIDCRCETKMLMRRGCNCGAMKAELASR